MAERAQAKRLVFEYDEENGIWSASIEFVGVLGVYKQTELEDSNNRRQLGIVLNYLEGTPWKAEKPKPAPDLAALKIDDMDENDVNAFFRTLGT